MQTKTARLQPDSATILERSRGIFSDQWEEFLRLRHQVTKTSDSDDIHDLRVALRRFRAMLKLFAKVLPATRKTGLNQRVRLLTGTLGGLRNIDEAISFFRSRISPEIYGNMAVGKILTEMRPKEFKKIRRALRDFKWRSSDRIVQKMMAKLNPAGMGDGNSISLTDVFSDASSRLYMPIQQLLSCSSEPEQCRSRHELRIAIKKWRYFLEFIAQVLTLDCFSVIELLKEYQTHLGRMNDVAVFAAMLEEMKLPTEERQYLRTMLQAEDALLLENFKALSESKPLKYVSIAYGQN